ncbi:acetyltransferase (GNAT) family protein [Rhizobium sp. PP-WC-2G-219]|nr:acetyltransferase (GNAT) family protein [Rhizobium sp. PP-WC-2G-219]
MPDDITVSDLRDAPQFREIMADRLWTAWWRDEGLITKDQLVQKIGENLTSTCIPFSLIAHRGDVFCGTVSVIEDDMPARPKYRPWLAALWVEEQARRQGVGERLIDAALEKVSRLAAEIHLYCTPENTPFYERRGWNRLETDVDGVNIFRRSTVA